MRAVVLILVWIGSYIFSFYVDLSFVGFLWFYFFVLFLLRCVFFCFCVLFLVV